MRVLILGALFLIPGSASADVRMVTAPATEKPADKSAHRRTVRVISNKCTNATNHFAHKGSVYRGEPQDGKKLTELPPADTYAAVYRLENGCAVPVLYREVRSVRARDR